MKYRNLPPWPEAKRGKKRANIKRPATYISMKKKNEKIPYVRAPGVQKKFKKERLRYGVSVQSLTSKGSFQLIQRLTKDGLLPIWKGKPLPTLQPTKLESIEVQQSQMCVGTSLLQKRVHHFHPIFFSGAGSSLTRLGHQAAVLCCALAGVPVTSTPVIPARARNVLMKQKSIRFRGHHKWSDVEADEVDLGKESLFQWTQCKVGAVGRCSGARQSQDIVPLSAVA